MTRPRAASVACVAALTCVGLLCLSCLGAPASPTPTPDFPRLETQVAAKLGATLTAKAPPTATETATSTPEPDTPTPEPTATETPTPKGISVVGSALVAYARQAPDGAMNLVLHNLKDDSETILTHFLEARHMRDLSWSRDGTWLIFVSAHDYMHSRRSERNVFAMRPDGTELQMITGDYMDPASAPGPYVTLKGLVQDGQGVCRVCAQGAAEVVEVAEDGSFQLPGVPVSAAWARAVCQQGDVNLQGIVDLSLGTNSEPSVTIPVLAGGQGWAQVSLSRDNQRFAGIFYHWAIDEQGERRYTSEGILYDWTTGAAGVLELPADTTLLGVDWSPVTDELVGTLVGEKATWLWRWDAQGKSLGVLLELPNPERLLLSAANPAWSPEGDSVAFELRQWDWWEETRRKTELMLWHVGDAEARLLVPTDWGGDAIQPSWASNGQRIYYQFTTGEPGAEAESKDNGTLWWVALGGEAVQAYWAEPDVSYLPAAHPRWSDYPPIPRLTLTPFQ